MKGLAPRALRSRTNAAIAVITLIGAALRLATLNVQSLWLDEAVTRELVRRSFTAMLSAIPHSESTPPLYYVLAWPWSRAFGTGAVGLRSLSAVIGIATIVVLAAVARAVAGERAAIAAAALCAFNPLLIWYSQEARSYALLVLLCALSLLCLLRGRHALWGLVAALSLATHYFALFVIGPELVWLIWRRGRGNRTVAIAAGAVIASGAALLPLAIVQAGGNRAAFITASPLLRRLLQVPKQLMVGYATPHAVPLTIVATLCVLFAAAGLRRSERALGALAACAIAVPVLLALIGADYVITRNLIAALAPLVVLAAAGASRERWGWIAVAALSIVGVIAFAGVETHPADQRDDWRGVAQALGRPLGTARALVIDPASTPLPLAIYAPLRPWPRGSTPRGQAAPALSVRVSEVDLIVLPASSAARSAVALPGFEPPVVEHDAAFTIVRYRIASPVAVAYYQVLQVSPARQRSVVVLER